MSLINSMLQDLDRRQALATDSAVAAVRVSTPAPVSKREWFWPTLAVLMALSVAWVAWVAFQVMPRPIVTKLALQAADKPKPRPLPQPVTEVQIPVTPAVAVEPAVVAAPPPPPLEAFRLAMELTTPVREPALPRPAKSEPPAKLAPVPAKAVAAPTAKAPSQGSVDKNDRAPAGSTAAANDFRRALQLLNQGRVAEAQQHLAAALKTDPRHAHARQVYAALLVEQGRVEPARRLLEEGLAVTPGHAPFALTLARIHAEERDYPAALGVMDKLSAAASADANSQALRGAVLQRMGRHAEAATAYQNALRAAPEQATSWLGLAISLEALNRTSEAAEAYRRSVRAGPLATEAREYAETRAAALQ